VHDLHVWGITPESMALSAHLDVDDLAGWATILQAARTVLHDRFGIDHVTLQPEATAQSQVVRLWPRKPSPHS
jgi:cobalt-zinc-cadmium efflux system protein